MPSLAGRLIATALLAVASVALASAPSVKAGEPVRSLIERRTENVVLQQFDISCGAAALATVLKFQHGEPVGEREVALRMIGRSAYLEAPELVRLRQGFSLLDMKRVAEGYGYRGDGLGKMTLGDLVARAPAIVPVDINGYRHFVVFIGRSNDRVLLADPAYGRRVMSAPAFEQAWIEYPEIGRVGLTVTRRDGLIPPNRLVAHGADFQLTN